MSMLILTKFRRRDGHDEARFVLVRPRDRRRGRLVVTLVLVLAALEDALDVADVARDDVGDVGVGAALLELSSGLLLAPRGGGRRLRMLLVAAGA